MTDLTAEQKQAKYAASRPKLVEAYPTIEYRVTMRDGTEKIERVIGLSQIAAYYPDAVQVTRTDWGGFY
jgi:hypothetical protein